VEWIDCSIDPIAEQVPEIRRADHRDEQVGSWLHAIVAERVAERARVVRNAGGAGDVDHAAKAHRRVDHEPDRGLRGSLRAKLQQVVDHHRRLGEVDHDVVDGLADRSRGQLLINKADRSDHVAIKARLDREALAVELLERVARRVRQRRRGGHDGEGRRHAGGEMLATHRSLRRAGLRASAGDRAGYDRLSLGCILCIGARNQ
jgi:hypothetical protein